MPFTEEEVGNIGSWEDLLFFTEGRHHEIADALNDWGNVRPCRHQVFRALQLTHPEKVKVVILGQDPYPEKATPDGLAFSSPDSNIPRSLLQIFEAIEEDVQGFVRPVGNNSLEPWAKQGVLLLNTALTVETGKPGSHSAIGWSCLITEVLSRLSQLDQHIVFALWGKGHAWPFEIHVDAENELRHLVKRYHPAANPGPDCEYSFKGTRQFREINDWLRNHDIRINWSLN